MSTDDIVKPLPHKFNEFNKRGNSNSTPNNIYRDANVEEHHEGNVHISSNLVVVEIGGQAVGLLKNVVIEEKIGQQPIEVWGDAINPDYTIGRFEITLTGELWLSTKMHIYERDWLPRRPRKLIAQSRNKRTFDVAIYPKKPVFADDSTNVIDYDLERIPIIKLYDCRYTGSKYILKAAQPIINNFSLVAELSEKSFLDFDTLPKNTLKKYGLLEGGLRILSGLLEEL